MGRPKPKNRDSKKGRQKHKLVVAITGTAKEKLAAERDKRRANIRFFSALAVALAVFLGLGWFTRSSWVPGMLPAADNQSSEDGSDSQDNGASRAPENDNDPGDDNSDGSE